MNFFIPLQSNDESNPCAASGCPGVCCMNLIMTLKVFEAHKIIGDQPYRFYDRKVDFNLGIATLSEILFYCGKNRTIPRALAPRRDALQEYRSNGSFANAGALVWIPGRCPNLATNGFCTIYEERPLACRSLEFRGPNCLDIRQRWELE